MPNAISITFDGTNAWVGDSYGGLTVVGPSLNILGTYATGQASVSPNDTQYLTFDGVHIWAASHNLGTVAELNPSNGAVHTYNLQGSITGMIFDGHFIWTTNALTPTSSSLTRIFVR
jgi:hypothetical protein